MDRPPTALHRRHTSTCNPGIVVLLRPSPPPPTPHYFPSSSPSPRYSVTNTSGKNKSEPVLRMPGGTALTSPLPPPCPSVSPPRLPVMRRLGRQRSIVPSLVATIRRKGQGPGQKGGGGGKPVSPITLSPSLAVVVSGDCQ